MVWAVERGDAYALLARLAAGEWGLAPLPPIRRAPGGKPALAWGGEGRRFSLSHSGPLAMCALDKGEVGCDVEVVRPRRAGLPARCLSREEYAWFLARGGRWEDFYTLWTMKEALVKCTGEGLRRPPREIAVPLLPPGERARQGELLFTALAGEEAGLAWRGAVCQRA